MRRMVVIAPNRLSHLLLRSVSLLRASAPTAAPAKPATTSSASKSNLPLVGWGRGLRMLSSSSKDCHGSEVDEINTKFAEAREDIESAMESKETIYFDEEAEIARESVKGVVDRFDALLEKVSEEEKGALTRSMGLKMQQLKAELQQLEE